MGKGKTHCWECRRRRLVCDSLQTGCKRCFKSGIPCPGYDEVKPARLRWLAPGRVISRNQPRRESPVKETDDNGDGTRNNGDNIQGSRVKAVVPRLRLESEVRAFVEAAEYFNSCIFQDILPMEELGSNPYLYIITPAVFQNGLSLPAHLRYSFLCMTFSHRTNRADDESQSRSLARNFYYYRGLAIRSLTQDLDSNRGIRDGITIAGIVALLLLDLQQGPQVQPGTFLNWRIHFDGVYRLIMLCGGMRTLVAMKGMEPLLLTLTFIAVFANTTSPASELTMTGAHIRDTECLIEHYGHRIFPFQMCPPPLFAHVVQINHLRWRATNNGHGQKEDLSEKAYDLLNAVENFSPGQWAMSKTRSVENWTVIAGAFQAAVAIYCTSSLQSCSVLPNCPRLRIQSASHGQALHSLLKESLRSPVLNRAMLWPLAMLGMEAARGSMDTREFVREQLSELSRKFGTSVPLTTKLVLERFWNSGNVHWDACFDKTYVFASQIAVDIGGVSSDSPTESDGRSSHQAGRLVFKGTEMTESGSAIATVDLHQGSPLEKNIQ